MTKRKTPTTTYRAGKSKCRRCKEVWTRKRGESTHLCSRCREHCSRCDVTLTDKNMYNSAAKRYICTACAAEIVEGSRGNKGYIARDNRLIKRYGITSAEYEDILTAQKGVCWICGAEPKGKRLAVDHEHVHKDKQQNPRDTRKRVRGLLCWACNGAIAKFNDDVVRLRNAADYLEQWPAQQHLKEKVDD